MEAQEPSALIRAFNRAHKDVVERLSRVDFAPISPAQVSATRERTEREILLDPCPVEHRGLGESSGRPLYCTINVSEVASIVEFEVAFTVRV